MGSASELILFYIFLLGLAVGSFLNVLIKRLPKMLFAPFEAAMHFFTGHFEAIKPKETLIWPPSYCPACFHRLNWVDLIPVLGYILRRGRCGYCGATIDWQYPVVELATGLLYVFVVQTFGLNFKMLAYLYLVSVLIAVFFIDLNTYLIPDWLTLPSLLVGIALSPKTVGLLQSLLGALLGFGIFSGISLFSLYVYPKKEGMGLGDVKLSAMLGAFLGVKCLIIALYLAFLLGGFLAVILILLKRRSRYDLIPFGPSMVAGALGALFFCPKILAWYGNLLR